jgi:hypothetical protein
MAETPEKTDLMNLPPWAKIALKWAIVLTAIVAGLGPDLVQLTGLVPAPWLAVASRVVAAAAAISAFLASSPLVKPLLETKGSETLYRHADEVARVEVASTSVPPRPLPIPADVPTNPRGLPRS